MIFCKIIIVLFLLCLNPSYSWTFRTPILLPRYVGEATATRRPTWRRHQHLSLLPVGSVSSSFSYARTTKRGSTATAGGVVLQQQTTTAPRSAVTTTAPTAVAAAASSDTLDRNIERLRTALCKASKTLAVAYEIVVAASKEESDNDPSLSWSSMDVDARSMQLRKIGAAALFVNDLKVAQQLVQEQESATNSFPGPLPVVYYPRRSGLDDDLLASCREAVDAGIAAVALPMSDGYMELYKDIQQSVPVVHVIETVEDATKLVDAWGADSVDGRDSRLPMVVMVPLLGCGDDSSSNADVGEDEDPSITNFIAIRSILPPDAVVIASVEAMQDDNREIQSIRKVMTASPSRQGPVLTVNAVLVRNAVVGDNEDVEYAEFVKSGLTAKRSTTFNVSGLTGSTNGHFGGVASTVAKTWLRPQRQQRAQ